MRDSSNTYSSATAARCSIWKAAAVSLPPRVAKTRTSRNLRASLDDNHLQGEGSSSNGVSVLRDKRIRYSGRGGFDLRSDESHGRKVGA
jgi:hypothetical protein